jgi:hypothetical protein
MNRQTVVRPLLEQEIQASLTSRSQPVRLCAFCGGAMLFTQALPSVNGLRPTKRS